MSGECPLRACVSELRFLPHCVGTSVPRGPWEGLRVPVLRVSRAGSIPRSAELRAQSRGVGSAQHTRLKHTVLKTSLLWWWIFLNPEPGDLGTVAAPDNGAHFFTTSCEPQLMYFTHIHSLILALTPWRC